MYNHYCLVYNNKKRTSVRGQTVTTGSPKECCCWKIHKCSYFIKNIFHGQRQLYKNSTWETGKTAKSEKWLTWAVCGGFPQWVFDTAIRGSQTHHCFILNTTNEKYVGKHNCGGKNPTFFRFWMKLFKYIFRLRIFYDSVKQVGCEKVFQWGQGLLYLSSLWSSRNLHQHSSGN